MERRRLANVLGIALAVMLALGFGLSRTVGSGGFGGDAAPTCADPAPWHEAAGFAGEVAAVAGPVAAATHEPDVGGAPTFLNLGSAHPDPDRFDVVIYEDVRDRFDEPPTDRFSGEEVCVQGEVRERDGVPQIILEAPSRIEVR